MIVVWAGMAGADGGVGLLREPFAATDGYGRQEAP